MSQQHETGINTGAVKRKANKTPTGGQARRLAQKPVEVMSKLSGSTKDPVRMQEHINYLSRNGKVELEDEKGQTLEGKERFKAINEWQRDHKEGQGRDNLGVGSRGPRANQRLTATMVFSMPPGTPPEAVKDAVRNLAKEEFGGKHKYLMALHTDTDSPHVHLCVSTKGIEQGQKRLHLSKQDTERIRQKFAEKMQEQGIDAEASPRAMRGVVRKGEKIAVVKARERLAEKGQMLDIDKAAIKEADDDRKGISTKKREWDSKIHEQQKEIRLTYVEQYKELLKEGKTQEAEGMKAFIKSLPPIRTRHDEIKHKMDERQVASNADRNKAFVQSLDAKKQQIQKPQQEQARDYTATVKERERQTAPDVKKDKEQDGPEM